MRDGEELVAHETLESSLKQTRQGGRSGSKVAQYRLDDLERVTNGSGLRFLLGNLRVGFAANRILLEALILMGLAAGLQWGLGIEIGQLNVVLVSAGRGGIHAGRESSIRK